MAVVREPLLEPVRIMDLRPTQITVGFREVEERRNHWRSLKKGARTAFLAKHMIPVVLGPKGRHYIVDHHHLARALYEEGVKQVYVSTFVNLRKVKPESFWFVLETHSWMFPFDAQGKRRSWEDIPKSVDKLRDDPFRSLAGELRRIGGYAKDITPFSEFLWADFLRHRVKHGLIKREFDAALKQAYLLARSKDAEYLPGWCGPVDGA